MRLRSRVLVGAVVALAVVSALPAAAQLFPGVTIVNDPINKVVLLQQLTQLEQELQIAEANIKNIGSGGWGSTIQNVSTINSQLTSVGTTISTNDPRNVAVSTATTQLQQIPSEESDLAVAQQLSDGAVGQVQVTAAGNRLQSLAIGQMQEQRELMLSNIVQNETYEQQATADQTNPTELHALDGKL